MRTRKQNRALTRHGGVLVYILFAMIVLMGMAALAVDIAMMYSARRRAQTAADSAALAAANLIPNSTAATTAAQRVTTANNATGPAFNITNILLMTSPSTVITLDDGTAFPLAGAVAVTVTGYVDARLSFAPVAGYRPTSRAGRANTKSVSASATIIMRPACSVPSGMGMAPFGIVADNPNSSNPDVAYVAKLLSTSSSALTPMPNTYQATRVSLKVSQWKSGSLDSGGNFGALDLGGNGANSYSDNISTPTTQTFQVGQAIPTKTGNMVGPTDQGVAARLNASNSAFTHRYADYINWFFGDQTKPIDTSMPSVTDNGNTYYYRQDTHRQELTDARLMVVPLISQPGKNGSTTATILAFAAFFIEVPGSGQITGRFVGIRFPQGGGGTCTGGGTFQWPRLIK